MSYSSSSDRYRYGRSMFYSSSSSPSKRRRQRRDSIEDEIIDRVLRIERDREEILREQFRFIVSNVQELERRRRRDRTRSAQFDRSISRKHRRRSDSICFQIQMIYQGNRHSKQGEEIMILQHRHIVFKGFLKNNESFTYRVRSIDDGETIESIELEIFINEFRLNKYLLDLQNGEISPETDLFQIETIRTFPMEETSTTMTTTVSNDKQQKKNSSKSKTSSQQIEPTKRKESVEKVPTTPLRPVSSSTNSIEKRMSRNSTTQNRLDASRSTLSSKKKTTTNQSDEDQNDQIKQESQRRKPAYGPPQLSTFVRSDSDPSDDEEEKTKKIEKKPLEQKNENENEEEKEKEEEKENEDEDEDEGTNGNGGSSMNFLQLLQAMSGGGIRLASGNDDTDGISALLTRLGMGNDGNQKRKSKNVTPRERGNVENYLLVYLDKTNDENSFEKRFRSLINYVKIFDDPDDCLAFINSIEDEKVIFIVTDQLGDPVVSRIQDLQQVFQIYILCENDDQVENWSKNAPKIRGIYTDFNDIFQQIRQDIEEDEEDLLSFNIARRETNMKDHPDFLLDRILKEILLDSDEMTDALKELIDFAREEYQNNDEKLEEIQLFENQFSKEKIFEFYQPKSFIYKMLKKAFRKPDVEILFKLRYFIQNFHQIIISSSRDPSIKTVYRTRRLKSQQVDLLKKQSEGNFLSFSHFFVASKEIPKQRIRRTKKTDDDDDDENDENQDEEILFEIELGQNQCQMSIDDENLLFTFGVVTKIENISKDEFGRTKLRVKLVSNDDQQLDEMIEPMRKEIRAPYPSLRLVKFFIELEEYSRAVLIGQSLLADYSGAKKDPLLALARIYHSLGTILYEKEHYDQALDVIKKSHLIYLRFLPEDSPQLSPTWNNMGSIYLRQGKTELALEHHEKALAIQLKSPSPDLPSIISYSNNIGGVYLKLERFDEALVHFKRAVQIEEQTLPKNHPELAGSYHRIGGVYFRQNNYEKALEFYNKTLEIELNSLPSNHPTIAVTYHNRGTAFEGLGRLEEAVETAEKAVEQLLKTLPKENPQVRMNQAYVDRLKQKLWVKQLFQSS